MEANQNLGAPIPQEIHSLTWGVPYFLGELESHAWL